MGKTKELQKIYHFLMIPRNTIAGSHGLRLFSTPSSGILQPGTQRPSNQPSLNVETSPRFPLRAYPRVKVGKLTMLIDLVYVKQYLDLILRQTRDPGLEKDYIMYMSRGLSADYGRITDYQGL
jgi:hypothetical protein